MLLLHRVHKSQISKVIVSPLKKSLPLSSTCSTIKLYHPKIAKVVSPLKKPLPLSPTCSTIKMYHPKVHGHEARTAMNGSVKNQIASRDVIPGKSLELRLLPQPYNDFCSFVWCSPKEDVIAFFRGVSYELEQRRNIWDFHMKVKDLRGGGGFQVEVYYGDENRGPAELLPGECISCFPEASLYPGVQPDVKAKEALLDEFCDQPYVKCWIDAKGRPGLIVTPVRHVERMSELEDEELFALWYSAVRALDTRPFHSLILNHGSYRNLPHLHLKVWVGKEQFAAMRQKWAPDKHALWVSLCILAKKQPRRRDQVSGGSNIAIN